MGAQNRYQYLSFIKAVDVLWLADSMSELWDNLPEEEHDDKLGLIYQASKKNMVAVNTGVGQTDRKDIF